MVENVVIEKAKILNLTFLHLKNKKKQGLLSLKGWTNKFWILYMHKKVIEVKITNPWAPDFTHLHKGSEYKPFDFNTQTVVSVAAQVLSKMACSTEEL